MPYMFEYTLFATLAFHHLSIGLILLTLVSAMNKWLIKDAELKSWLWMTVFVVATITPFALINADHLEVNQAQFTKITEGTTAINALTSASEASAGSPNMVNNKTDFNDRFWHLRPNIVFDYSVLFTAALIIWLIGSIWRIATITFMWLRTRDLNHHKGQLSREYSDYLGISVYISNRVSSPMVLGYFKSRVILPQSIVDALALEKIKAILQHEKAHITRKDNFFALFQEVIAIAFWWSPVMRKLNKNIHIQREIACDIRAAQNCNSAKQYAQSLLDCAKLMVHEHRSILAMGLFSKKKELKERITLVLKQPSTKKLHASLIIIVCALFSAFSIQAAQILAPKVSIKQTSRDALHYSLLPLNEGQALINAVIQNDLDTIIDLQNQGVNINTPAIGDGTALMLAVKKNDLNMAVDLINLGADVNQSSRGDGNPLIVAAMKNNVEALSLLLSAGADIDAVVPRDETALITASFYGNLEAVVFLVENGADVSQSVTTGRSDGYEVRTALSRARNQEISDFLIANGASK